MPRNEGRDESRMKALEVVGSAKFSVSVKSSVNAICWGNEILETERSQG